MVEMRGVLDFEMICGNDEHGVGRSIECSRWHLNELDGRHCKSWSRQRIHDTATIRSFGSFTSIEKGMRLDSAEQPTAQ